MAWDIIYDRQFIRVSDTECIPVVLIGPSNVFEPISRGRSKRVREWLTLSLGSTFTVTEKSLKDYLANQLKRFIEKQVLRQPERPVDDIEQEIKNDYGYYLGVRFNGKAIFTYRAYVSYFVNAIRDAVPIEDISWNATLTFRVNSERSTTLNNNSQLDNFTVRTAEEFWAALGAFKLSYGDTGWSLAIFGGFESIRHQQKLDKRCHVKTHSVKTKKIVSHYYALTHSANKGHYLVRFTKFGYRWAADPIRAEIRKFQSENSAKAWLKRCRRDEFEVVRIDSPTEVIIRRSKKNTSPLCQ